MRSSDIVVDDASLTLAAKGVFVTVTLLGNGCSTDDIARHCREDARAVQVALQELASHGYVSLNDGRASVRDAADFGMP